MGLKSEKHGAVQTNQNGKMVGRTDVHGRQTTDKDSSATVLSIGQVVAVGGTYVLYHMVVYRDAFYADNAH